MIGKTIAMVSGMESATTAPDAKPRLMMLTAMMMAIACQSDSHEFVDRSLDDDWLVATERRLDAEWQVGDAFIDRFSHVPAECDDIAAVAHRDGEADRGFAVDAKHRLRRVGIGAVAPPRYHATGSAARWRRN